MKTVRYDYRGKKLDRLPAVLIGGLSLIRPLGMAGIPVIVIDSASNKIRKESKSRYVLDCYYINGTVKSRDRSRCEEVISVGKELCDIFGARLPLFYGTDDELNMLYENTDDLSKHYIYVTNDRTLGLVLIDKMKFYSLCVNNGIKIAKTVTVDVRENQTGAIIEELKFPVILKPMFKTNWFTDKRFEAIFGKVRKATVVHDSDELMRMFRNPVFRDIHNNIVIQEYIPGNEDRIHSFHGFSDENGEILACYTGKKIRTYPFEMGESSYIELIEDSRLLEQGKEIVKILGIKGPYKIDFKKDPRTDQYYVLEINARYNLWHYLGAKNGINLPSIAYEYMVQGGRNHTGDYTHDYRWLNFKLDYLVFKELSHAKKMTLKDWVFSINPSRTIYSVFSWDDPWPFFYMTFKKLMRKLAA